METTGHPADSAAQKKRWRQRLNTGRRARSAAEIAHARSRLADHLGRELPTLLSAGAAVCAYLPLPSEPMPTHIADLLRDQGFRPLVPITRPGQALGWAPPDGPLRTAALGVSEPATAPLEFDQCGAELVLVPALAVDAAGIRLGRGGGYYDRTLVSRRVRTVALIFDDELVDALPHDPHDVAVDGVLTPGGGLRWLARRPVTGTE